MPSIDSSSMQFVPDVGGTLSIRAGDANVEVWVFGKERELQPEGR
jgi:hypothetical protein